MKLNNEMYISIFIYNSLRKYELKNIQFLNAFSSGMRMIASFIYDSLWKNGWSQNAEQEKLETRLSEKYNFT